MANLYRIFRNLLPDPPLLIGTVSALMDGGAYVDLPTGGTIFVRGEAAISDVVFVRNGAIEGLAPALPIETIEI